MDRINVNIAALEDKIDKLKKLQTICSEIDVSPEALEGSGMSIEMLQAIDSEYVQVRDTVLTLLSHSISFFQNMKASLVEADEKAAHKLN